MKINNGQYSPSCANTIRFYYNDLLNLKSHVHKGNSNTIKTLKSITYTLKFVMTYDWKLLSLESNYIHNLQIQCTFKSFIDIRTKNMRLCFDKINI